MTVKEFSGNPLLCPLSTLLAYIDRTKFKRGSVDQLFVLMTTQEPRPLSGATIVCWAKSAAGLGQFKVHSNHSASSTSALLMGMAMDVII